LETSRRPAGSPHVFPPDVLAVEVKFLCGACKNKLRADARWEGRSIKCPVCSEKARVPRWSRQAEEKIVQLRDPHAPVAPAKVGLSVAEVEFLSGSTVARPRMAG
jgi:DNA-directed RNA polymerase subunit RPC12/RpoP